MIGHPSGVAKWMPMIMRGWVASGGDAFWPCLAMCAWSRRGGVVQDGGVRWKGGVSRRILEMLTGPAPETGQPPAQRTVRTTPAPEPLEALPDTAPSVLGPSGGFLRSRPAGPRPAAAEASIAKYQLLHVPDLWRRRRQPVQASLARESEP
jgi:hypothetical protein